jgi:hypothetical protein
MKMLSWLTSWFSQPGQGVLRLIERRMIAPGYYDNLPTAGSAFRYGIAADATGVQVCQPDGSGWAWRKAGGSLDDLSDVVITAAASGEILRHNGTNWVDSTFKILTGSTTWDPASINDDQVATASVTVTGVVAGDPCFAGFSQFGAQNVLLEAHVSGADTVQVLLYNASGVAQNPDSGTVNVICFDVS